MSRAVPAVLLWVVMLVLVAQCMGCGGADDDEPPAAPPIAGSGDRPGEITREMAR